MSSVAGECGVAIRPRDRCAVGECRVERRGTLSQ